ncbi:MAG: nitroreductase family protein [Bacteroidales bacterium]
MSAPSINIQQSTCIKCRKCVEVCPAGIMMQASKNEEINIKYPHRCIGCGHCVDACPSNSVEHSHFPPEKQELIDTKLLPTQEQLMMLIKSRRSNRAISTQAIPQKSLQLIIEAARYAPTASNKQEVSITVLQTPEELQKISDFTINVFSSIANKLNHPLIKWLLKPFLKKVYAMIPLIKKLSQEHKNGNDPILRHGTAVLIFHTPKHNQYGCQDANLAYQNASLMAQTLGISQIYMGFVIRAIKQSKTKMFEKEFGIQGNIHAIMSIGIPKFNFLKYTER